MKKIALTSIIVVSIISLLLIVGIKNNRDDLLSYGGKSPSETIQLLIEALKQEDIELASKYFMPNNEGNVEKWQEALINAKEENRFPKIINLIEQSQPNPENSTHSGDFKYVIRNEQGNVESEINLELIRETGAWKIEGM